MTLNVAIGRSNQYLLHTHDFSIYSMPSWDDDRETSTPVSHLIVPRPKCLPITNYAVASFGGCIAVYNEFVDLLSARLSADDDIDAVYAAARDALAFLMEHDRPGASYDIREYVDDAPETDEPLIGKRGFARKHLVMVLTGFRKNGEGAIIQLGDGEFQDYDESEQLFSCTVPMGVPVDDALAFYVILEPLALDDALEHALAIHTILSAKHPSRVTTRGAGVALLWDESGCRPSPAYGFDFDTADISAEQRDRWLVMHDSSSEMVLAEIGEVDQIGEVD